MFVTTYALLWFLALFQGLVIVALVREVGELRAYQPAPSSSLRRGTKAPNLPATDLQTGNATSLHALGRSPAVLCFLSSTCLDCRRLAAELAQEPPEMLSNLILLCQGDRSAVLRGFGPASKRIRTFYAEDYGALVAAGYPAAYALDGNGRIQNVIDPVTVNALRQASTSLLQSAGGVLQPT